MNRAKPNRPLLLFSILITGFTLQGAAILWFRVGEKAFATSLFLLGWSLGPCMGAYAILPTARKQVARRIVLLTGGLSIMAFSLLGKANLDLEGFFMLLFLGAAGTAIGHTLITVIIGPLSLEDFCADGAAGEP